MRESILFFSVWFILFNMKISFSIHFLAKDIISFIFGMYMWENSKELGQKSQTKLCLCELASGLVRKLQGTGAKVADQTVLVWVGIWPCEKATRNWGKSLRPDLACVSGYLALWESQTSRKTVFKAPRWFRVPQM
jgi:hypothetical protein